MKYSRRQFVQAASATATLCALNESVHSDGSALLKKAIPSSGELLPVIGIGTNRYGVGDDRDLRAPLKLALGRFHSLGGTLIDTAPQYRSSEIVLGELIAELGINDELFMATKVDVEGRDEITERMKRSLTRLNTDPMPLMQVHNFIGWETAIPIMQEWKQEGRLRYIGVTTSSQRQYELMEEIMRRFPLDFIQVNYSLANQRESAERLLPLAVDRGTAVLVNRPFGGGNVFEMLSRTTIPGWAADFGIESWGQFLLKYVLSHRAVTAAIPGMTKERHVIDNLKAASGALPDAQTRKKMELFFDNIPA